MHILLGGAGNFLPAASPLPGLESFLTRTPESFVFFASKGTNF